MPKNLVIVESPAKARTIGQYLGREFKVASSFGHIRDLPKKGIGVDIAKNFEPTYEVAPDKAKVVRELKQAAKGAEVWLASDEDREGEAIAWHVCFLLGLDPTKTKRIVFHEITKPAIAAAVAKPRTIDMQLVDAQQARRILDRLVGYELSPVLWKKVRTGLSAGRVQSVAVRLIVEREREIRDFKAGSTFKITAVFSTANATLSAELEQKVDDKETAQTFLQSLIGCSFSVKSVEQKPGQRSPSAPFITSTLQQEASRKLGYSVRQTMSLAQKLYENGQITYMRTDSISLSPLAIAAASDYITKNYGAKYAQNRQYKTRDSAAQEAHEAIRPTDLTKLSAGADAQQSKLYELIWRRTMASQMAPAEIQKTTIEVAISGRPEIFVASGEVITFDGFLKVYGGAREDQILPELAAGDKLNLDTAEALETYNRAPARYTEAALVRKLEALKIGRPSTYAPTISTIQDRGYVERGDVEGEAQAVSHLKLEDDRITEVSEQVMLGADRGKLLPTPVAEVVTDFLRKYFSGVIDYDFTARAEKEFDEIAEGKLSWQKMLDEFYAKFHPLVEQSEQATRAEASQARTLGTDPKSGLPVVARFGRYGPVLQLGETEDKDKKVRFAPLPEGTSVDAITLDQALPMFNLPRSVGVTEQGEPIQADIGRFGPYIKVGKTYVSIKGSDPFGINEADARKLLAEHYKKQAERQIADFGKVKILRGPYGPYITDGKKNARIPKSVDPEKLDETEALAILAKAPAKRSFKRRSPKKK